MNRAIVIRYYGGQLSEKQIAEIAAIIAQTIDDEDQNKLSIAVFDSAEINKAILNCTPVVLLEDDAKELVNLMKTKLSYTDSRPAISYVYAVIDKINTSASFFEEFMKTYKVLANIGELQFANVAEKCGVKKHFVETLYNVGKRVNNV